MICPGLHKIYQIFLFYFSKIIYTQSINNIHFFQIYLHLCIRKALLYKVDAMLILNKSKLFLVKLIEVDNNKQIFKYIF